MNQIFKNSDIIINNHSFESINNLLKSENYSSIFILTDQNTNEYCLPILLPNLETELKIEIIELEAGESQKDIEICIEIWKLLIDFGADKKSLLINLGGGVLSDLGGFIASTYKRGIDFVNIPTTLLAMVDASIGGKNGIDFGFLKNQIGTVSNPKLIFINSIFLETLPQDELVSGFAEMLKHALISDKNHWEELKLLDKINPKAIVPFIEKSISIKLKITQKDPNENGLRKLLNFGHTIGHAIESYFFELNEPILHGNAVAIGMKIESEIAYQKNFLKKEEILEIKQTIDKHFKNRNFTNESVKKILELMKFDKKNSHGIVKFALIDSIGHGITDVEASNELIIKVFNIY